MPLRRPPEAETALLRAEPTQRRADRRLIAAAFGLGLAMAAGQAPLSWSLVGLLGLVGLLALADRAPSATEAARIGWAAGFGHFLGSMFWIVEPFFVDPWRHGWMAPFALVLLPGGLALFWGAAFWLGQRLARGWRRLFLTATLLAAAETSRAFVLTGFPWGLIGYLWIDAPQMQLAAVIGPHGLTLATVLTAALAAVWIGRPPAWRLAPLLAVVLVVAAHLWGQAGLEGADPEPAVNPVTVRVVQPNAEQSLKWDAARAEEYLGRLLRGTAAAPPGAVPDLIVWPETSVQYLLNGSEALLARIDGAAAGRPVALGIVRRDEGRYFNSLVVTGPGGDIAEVYDKHHLTPFGEYVPFGELAARFGIQGLAASTGEGFSPGPGPRLIELGAAGRALALICYEAIFPQHLSAAERPRWILQVTNDAWFGEIAGPYQHLAQTRLRAVEQGLPLVRAANTGVSAVIDGRGRILAHLGLGVEGFVDAELPPALPPTPYARTGDWPVLALLVLLSLALIVVRRRESD